MFEIHEISEIPEIQAFDTRKNIVRIPPEVDVPLTARVRRILDTPAFQRLSRLRQLGLVARVYPGATHTRFEHCLGVYRLAVLLTKRLALLEEFAQTVPGRGVEIFLLAALLHDLGHYPFCHPIEDMKLPGGRSHERAIERFMADDSGLARCLREDWDVDPSDILYLLDGKIPARDTFLKQNPGVRTLLASMLSGPVDIDKMDYLQRDSLHAGVPYGKNFDQERLLASLCLNPERTGLAISAKGKTAAELMVFARYVMFSEVYWHHTVRSATAMFQRLFYEVFQTSGPGLVAELENLSDFQAVRLLETRIAGSPAYPLWDGLFGERRILYKQVAEYGIFDYPEIYQRIARRPFAWLVAEGERVAAEVSKRVGVRILPHEILIDAPPVEREVEFRVQVFYPKERRYRPLAEVSPVVRALAVEQFDDFVKRVRVFVHPDKVDVAEPILREIARS